MCANYKGYGEDVLTNEPDNNIYCFYLHTLMIYNNTLHMMRIQSEMAQQKSLEVQVLIAAGYTTTS